MKITESSLPGVLIIEPVKHGDSRGFFLETFRQDALKEYGVSESFVQDNHSRSQFGVLRGLHYQLEQPQGKLVRIASGKVFDVAVDVRKGAPDFGKWFGCILDEESMRMMYIPPGFAHGFLVLSSTADFIYKCTDYYHPQSEQGILWNDRDIGIVWPQCDNIKLSKKDSTLPRLNNQVQSMLPEYSGSLR